jgi:zinc transport system ATP-binding protein
MSIVSFDGVFFSYERWPVLEDVSFTVADRDFLAVIGPNGGGKTTILRLMLGLIRPARGAISVFGAPAGKESTRIGYVPQSSTAEKGFPLTVEEVVLQGTLTARSLFPFYDAAQRAAARRAMTAVDILPLAGRLFDELSGGQKQRTLIARAIVAEPQLLLLDEPVSSVDSTVERDVYALFKELNERMAIVMVSHDLGFVSSYVERVACVNRRLVIKEVSEMTQDIIDEKYRGHMHMVGHTCGL